MRLFAPQSVATDTAVGSYQAMRRRLPAPVAPISAVHSDGAAIQRKSNCACGGGCPSCQSDLSVQAKLAVSKPGDVYEQEADRVADQIQQMPESPIEPKQARMGIDIQRISTSDYDPLQNAPDVQLSHSGGRSLSPATRQFMEPRFGTNFSQVRVHTDQDAHQTASQLNARAFTFGRDIWLGKGESEQNSSLMAHELTHVLQQGAASKTDGNSPSIVGNQPASPRIQMAPLPCTTRTTIDVYPVNLPNSTRTIMDDLPSINSVLCQCGIEIVPVGGQSWPTAVLDRDAPLGSLNDTGATPSREMSEMLAHRPGGNVIHAYYVPRLQSGAFATAVGAARFTPPLPDSLIVANGAGAVPIVPAHELGHVLMNSGAHHTNRDNLMAGGTVNSGAGELEQTQCNLMP